MSFRRLTAFTDIAATTDISQSAETGLVMGRFVSRAFGPYVDVSSIGAGDTWTVQLINNIDSASGGSILATMTVTATGLYAMTVGIGRAQNHVQLTPNRYRANLDVNGGTPNLSCTFYESRAGGGIVQTVEGPWTTDVNLDIPLTPVAAGRLARGGGAQMSLFHGVTAIVGTWDLKYYLDAAKTVLMAQQLGITTVVSGLATWQAPFNLNHVAIPYPQMLEVVNTAGATPSITIKRVLIGVL